jgi:hypothetical protein
MHQHLTQTSFSALSGQTPLGNSPAAVNLRDILEHAGTPRIRHTVMRIAEHFRADLREMRSLTSRGLYERLTNALVQEAFQNIDSKGLTATIKTHLCSVLIGIRRDELRNKYGDDRLQENRI